MRNFALSPKTEICLGLIHATDGVERANRRIALAHNYVPEFGIATECGFARARKPVLVRNLLTIYAGAAREPASGSRLRR